MPGAAPASSIATTCAATSAVLVGCPRWSSTTSTVLRSDASRNMVRTKLGPVRIESRPNERCTRRPMGGEHPLLAPRPWSSCRRRGMLGRPPCRRRPVEHVVGGELHHPGLRGARPRSPRSGADRVHGPRGILVRLGIVHPGPGRGVSTTSAFDQAADTASVSADVQLGVRERVTTRGRREASTRSVASIPPAPVIESSGSQGCARPSWFPPRRGCRGTRAPTSASPRSNGTSGS